MADSTLSVLDSSGSAINIDTRTEGTNSQHRQVIVVGDPDTNSNIADVQNEDPGPTSTLQGMVVRLAGSAHIMPANGTLRVFLDPATGLPGGTNTLGTITGITNSISVYLGGTAGSIAVNVGKIQDTISVYLGGTGGTIAANIGKIDGTAAVFFSPAEPTIKGITNTIGVYLSGTAGSIAVNVGKIQDTISVYLSGTAGTIGANIGTVAGTVAVFFSPAVPTVFSRDSSTAIIPSTVSGTASGVGASGNTIISPISGITRKIYAYSITTTAITSTVARFTNGAGTSPTEFWRLALQSSSGVASGANLAIQPPGYLFATGTTTTLAILLDSGIVFHYSVSYFNESA